MDAQDVRLDMSDTLDRIVRAAGFSISPELELRVDASDPAARGRELVEVLELAAQFPARHTPTLDMPAFGPRPGTGRSRLVRHAGHAGPDDARCAAA